MKSFASSKSRSGFEPWYEDIMKNMVVGGGGITGIQDLAQRGPAKYFAGDAVADLTKRQLEDMNSIRRFANKQTDKGSTLGDAARQLQTTYTSTGNIAKASVKNARNVQDAVNREAKGLSKYGTGLMDYGDAATKTGLTQDEYAGYTPFQKAQLESMLAGDVDVSRLQDVQDATARQGLSALRPQLAAIRAQTGTYQRGGGSGTNKARRMAEEKYTQQMADTWAPLAHQSYEAAQERRLPAGQLALSAQLAAQQLGTKGADIRRGASDLRLGAGDLAQKGYGTALGARGLGLQAANAAPGIVGAQMGAMGQGLSMMDRIQAQKQSEIDANMAKWNYNQNKDAMHLRNMLGLMGGARVPTVGRGRPSALSSLMNFGTMLSGFF